MGIEEHYNKVYSETEHAFGGEKGEPTAFVTRLADYLVKGGDVLELGAGQGRNSLWLAQQGFQVVALEMSDTGVEQITARAAKDGLSVSAHKADIRQGFDGAYDAIVSTYVTHHLTKDEAGRMINDMKSHTKPGGFNVLEVFTNEGDFFAIDQTTDRFYPALGELRSLYSDWEIIDYKERPTVARTKKEDGTPMRNVAASIIARRMS